jgi:quercetin dioxygenase-like cupin family protein
MSSHAKIERWDEACDGALTSLRLRRKLERYGYRVSTYVYSPGTFFPTHTHAVNKIDAVVSGRFRIVLESEEIVLGPGDSVWVPRGAAHSAEVVGDEEVVSLDAVAESG